MKQNIIWLNLLLMLLITNCVNYTPKLVEDDNVYLYQGKEQIIVSFFKDRDINKKILNTTSRIINFIRKQTPKNFLEKDFYIEGLTGESFTDFFIIGDSLFLSFPYYKNKTLIYAYLSSLYERFMVKYQLYPFIPLIDIERIFEGEKINKKENISLISVTAQYAIDKIFFVSILEFLERPERYFYPSKTKTELFRIVIFPELLGFWNSLEFRFGKDLILKLAQKNYTPEDFYIGFGEKISDLESYYVKSLKKIEKKSLILKNTNIYNQLTNVLQLYMSGTKRSLMAE